MLKQLSAAAQVKLDRRECAEALAFRLIQIGSKVDGATRATENNGQMLRNVRKKVGIKLIDSQPLPRSI